MIRFSRREDEIQIRLLLRLCFENRIDDSCTDNLDGRYLVFEDNKRIIAVTGLKKIHNYKDGVEVDWSCTHPEFRHRGIMHQLFERMLEMTDENIYCSCWKMDGKDKVELHSLMENFEFECILEGHIKHNAIKCSCTDKQVCRNFHKGCMCQEDLYVRRGAQE